VASKASIVTAIVILAAPVSVASASAQPSPGHRLQTYLWGYRHWLLRPYVSGVSVSGGHMAVVSGKSRLRGATANVHETLHDQPPFAKAARFMCQVAIGGVRRLHLGISSVQVWSVEGRLVARC
jgi:hypothetical protein